MTVKTRYRYSSIIVVYTLTHYHHTPPSICTSMIMTELGLATAAQAIMNGIVWTFGTSHGNPGLHSPHSSSSQLTNDSGNYKNKVAFSIGQSHSVDQHFRDGPKHRKGNKMGWFPGKNKHTQLYINGQGVATYMNNTISHRLYISPKTLQ